MKVLVTGSRNFNNFELMKQKIKESGATIVVHGDARGADSQAKLAARQLGIEQRAYPAQWSKFGKTAGPIRNQQMIDEEHRLEEPIDKALAFPAKDSIGTYDMIRRLQKHKIPTEIISDL